MASNLSFEDLISGIEIRPLENKGELLAIATVTIGDALCINCFLKRPAGSNRYLLNWPGHKDQRTQKWYKDVWFKYENGPADMAMVSLVAKAYERKIKGPPPVINSKVNPNHKDPFDPER